MPRPISIPPRQDQTTAAMTNLRDECLFTMLRSMRASRCAQARSLNFRAILFYAYDSYRFTYCPLFLPPAAQTGNLREPSPRALLRLYESIAIPGWRAARPAPPCVRPRATERTELAASRV